MQQVSAYVGKWLQFQSLWDLEAEYVFARLGDALERWQQLLAEIKKTRATFDTSATERAFGGGSSTSSGGGGSTSSGGGGEVGTGAGVVLLVVDYGQVQARVNAKYDAWQRDVLSRFGVKLGVAMKEMHASILKARNDLEHHSIEGMIGGGGGGAGLMMIGGGSSR